MPLHSVNYMLSVCVQNFLKLSCRCRHRSHYDVLKVAKDCSTKEIRESFIELTKKFHPDVNSGGKSHTSFLRISEAYNILSRPLSRRQYDAELAIKLQETTWPRKDLDPDSLCWACRTWSESRIFHARRPTMETERQKHYYGIIGIKKVPHIWIVVLCLTTAGLALLMQLAFISRATTRTRERMILQSKAGEEALATVRAEAAKFGNEEQLKRLINRAKLQAISFPGFPSAKPEATSINTSSNSKENIPKTTTKLENTPQDRPSTIPNILKLVKKSSEADSDATSKQKT